MAKRSVRGPVPSNGTVPCHIVEGNRTNLPGLGSIVRNGARSRPSSRGGSPKVSQPAFRTPPIASGNTMYIAELSQPIG